MFRNFTRSLFAYSRRFLAYLLPFRLWVGELRDRDVLRADIIAGITVAMVLVPQSMAYAQLAGLPAYYGLYASFLPPVLAALLGSSRQLQTGPVAVVSLLTAAALEPIASANPEGYIAYAVLLALMVGGFQLLLGMLRLGALVDFISHPVVVGFTNAAALIIATSQLDKIFGVSVEKGDFYLQSVWRVLVAITQDTHLPTLIMATAALMLIVVLVQRFPRLPAVLIAVVVTTTASYLLDYAGMGGAIVGTVPVGLPDIAVPAIDWGVASQLLSTALVISLVGFMEAISI
ncbi:MAG: SulP family inorganic anion transporter, partial [Proteobacteria bacterium]|nr:SulP family inorganic anion transporter [Pseudomonadota bacterium]